MNQRFLGIILPKSIYDTFPEPEQNQAVMLNIFNETAASLGFSVCYFKFFQIKPGMKTIKAYVWNGTGYSPEEVPAPTVIYTRVLDELPSYQTHIRSLQKSGITIFNVPNFDVKKYEIHQLLYQNAYIRPNLPHTELLTLDALNSMKNYYPTMFLKLNYGECGKGAMKLKKVEDGWELSYKRPGSLRHKKERFQTKLPKVLQQRMHQQEYIVQEYIPLATYKNNSFDMRVAAQKDGTGKFQISQILCKVATDDDYLTNGAHGGTSYRLKDIASETNSEIPYNEMKKRISAFSLYVANYLNEIFPDIGDLGFDIGITKEGKPYFIECNFISDYVGGLIHDGKLLHEDIGSVFSTPIEYAGWLLKQQDK